MIIEKITCPCGCSFDWENDESIFSNLLRPKFCDPCQEIEDKRNAKEHAAKLAEEAAEKLRQTKQRVIERLDAATPARYRETDIADESFNLELWQRVAKWIPTSKAPWLGLIGTSGACKSRCAYLALRELVLASIESRRKPMTFATMTSYQFSEAVRNQYSKREAGGYCTGEIARDAIDRMATADVVLFDDLGKAKNTPAVSAELFAVIDRRHAENLPMIWTANSTPDEIVVGMGDDMAGPLSGRLVELSQIITI